MQPCSSTLATTAASTDAKVIADSDMASLSLLEPHGASVDVFANLRVCVTRLLYFTGTTTGAPVSTIINTRNRAGCFLLAFLLMVWMSSGLS
jgi:hypothetical protein